MNVVKVVMAQQEFTKSLETRYSAYGISLRVDGSQIAFISMKKHRAGSYTATLIWTDKSGRRIDKREVDSWNQAEDIFKKQVEDGLSN